MRLLLSFLLLCVSANAGGFGFKVGVDAQVINWRNRAAADVGFIRENGIYYTALSSELVLNRYVSLLRAAGLYPGPIKHANLFVGRKFPSDGIADIRTPGIPIIADAGNGSDSSPSGGAASLWTYSEDTGLARPAGSGYLNTGFVPSVDCSNGTNMHFSVWVVTSSTEAVWTLGATDVTGGWSWGLVGPSYPSLGTRLDLIGTDTGAADSGGHGYYIGDHAGANAVLYKNGSVHHTVSNANTEVNRDTYPVTIFALNCPACGGAGVQGTSKTLGCYTLGTGLGAAGASALYGITTNVLIGMLGRSL